MARPGFLPLCAASVALVGARVWLRAAPGHAVRWSTRADRTLARNERGDGPAGEAAMPLARAVRAIGVRLPSPATCLEQGIALLMLTTIARIPAKLIVGVSRPDDVFRAHAWVECEGHVVLGAEATGFSPLPCGDASSCRT